MATPDDQVQQLLDFGRRFPHPDGGSAWLDGTGAPDLSRPVFTWITARMAHSYSLGALLGRPGDRELAQIALDGLRGRLRDTTYGGWVTGIGPDGAIPDEKACYTHAFVVLAGSSGVVAGLDGANELLEQALEVWLDRFFEPSGLFADAWDRSFGTLSDYRGVNANMHAVEALLAAADVTGDHGLRSTALGISHRVALEFAEPHGWRIPEHFDPHWQPLLEHNADRPDDQFQPYGATIGHGLEWSRLLLHLEATLGDDAPDWLAPAAAALFERAATDGWAVDGAEGFVYTTDWSGVPVVRDRMHWVAAEAYAAAHALHRRTGDPAYAARADTWWGWIERDLIDHEYGSWYHQLDPQNHLTGTVWPGKPDIYHALQACLVPSLPLAPSFASALAARR